MSVRDLPTLVCDAAFYTLCHAVQIIIQQLLLQFIPLLCHCTDEGVQFVNSIFLVHLEQELFTCVKSFKSLLSAITGRTGMENNICTRTFLVTQCVIHNARIFQNILQSRPLFLDLQIWHEITSCISSAN
ncbi:hypothetical protein AVEN_1866-1 [Araneus ventricosus]|uniref:Uncharacterized protein n=1 Tax=Araneus ventricosus TaxID=182803 RepID=A0A4Y2JFS0_ARAVE|nr:hypothetical protein AVEN_1866-1 [Araneus ventricosus]